MRCCCMFRVLQCMMDRRHEKKKVAAGSVFYAITLIRKKLMAKKKLSANILDIHADDRAQKMNVLSNSLSQIRKNLLGQYVGTFLGISRVHLKKCRGYTRAMRSNPNFNPRRHLFFLSRAPSVNRRPNLEKALVSTPQGFFLRNFTHIHETTFSAIPCLPGQRGS